MSDELPSNVVTRLLDDRIDQALDRRMRSSGGGGGDDNFGARLASVEQRMSEIQASLGRLESKLDQLPKAADFFELKGRVSQLPTIWQMLGIVAAIFGLAFALLRFAGAHP